MWLFAVFFHLSTCEFHRSISLIDFAFEDLTFYSFLLFFVNFLSLTSSNVNLKTWKYSWFENQSIHIPCVAQVFLTTVFCLESLYRSMSLICGLTTRKDEWVVLFAFLVPYSAGWIVYLMSNTFLSFTCANLKEKHALSECVTEVVGVT